MQHLHRATQPGPLNGAPPQHAQPQWHPQAQWAPHAQWNAQPQGFAPTYAPVPAPVARRKSPLRWLLLALMGLGLLALAGLVLVNLTTRPAEIAYANDDYQVPAPELNPPEIPIPETLEQGQEWMANNALYTQLAPAPVRCNEPPIDVATASDAALKTHFENLMECLVRVWQPPLTQAGFQIYRPTVTIYIEEISTKCGSGKLPQNAFYCGADQQIYWSNTLGPVLTPFRDSRYAGDYVMAHEFGHAIQGRTGILTSRNWLLSETPEKDVQLQLRRRTEVQADCFAGMFLRAVSVSRGLTQADADALQKDFYGGGDDVLSGDANFVGDHGLGASRQYWGTTGLTTSEAAKCNTFVAPASQVR